MRPTSRLAADAFAAEEAGDDETASVLYLRLETEDPDDPAWSKKLAGVYRRLGRTELRVGALIRAAEAHDRRGEPMKGLATLKLARDIAPRDGRLDAAMDRLRRALPDRAPKARSNSYPRPETGTHELAVIPLIRRARAESQVGGDIVEVQAAVFDPRSADLAVEAELTPDAEISVEVDILPPIPLFSSLDGDTFARLFDSARTEHRGAHERIFTKGDRAGALYVVVDGAVDVFVDRSEPVARIPSGEFFGEMSLFTGRPRNATVVTAGPTELLVIDHANVLDIIRLQPSVLDVLLRFFRERLVTNVLASMPALDTMSRDAQADLRDCFQLLDVVSGTTIIRQGQPSPGVFLVVDGRLDVSRTNHAGVAEQLALLDVGSFVGEISTIGDVPAIATVKAASTSVVLALPREHFGRVAARHPALVEHVSALAAARLEALRHAARS